MKTTELKLSRIETTGGMTKIAHIAMSLDVLGKQLNIELSTAGLGLRINSSHTISELNIILDWLKEDSESTPDSLRNNQSEVIIFAKELIKADKFINSRKSI